MTGVKKGLLKVLLFLSFSFRLFVPSLMIFDLYLDLQNERGCQDRQTEAVFLGELLPMIADLFFKSS